MRTIAEALAEGLVAQDVERIYSLPGSHMKPLWHALDKRGVRVVTARDERAAVHMAQAEAELRGRLAVAILTAGPGLTNGVTGIAAAHLDRAPVLVIGTRAPLLQDGMGALEEIDQVAVVQPLCRAAHAVLEPRHALPRLDLAISAAIGDDGPPGPAYYELPSDLFTAPAPRAYAEIRRRTRSVRVPAPEAVEEAAALLRAARRPLVIAGREALAAGDALPRFVAAAGAAYLDTRASRDGSAASIGSFVPALRARAMAEADLVVTLGRRLDFELGYGSPAVFRDAKAFLRIGRGAEDVTANRRGDVELRADVGAALAALLDADLTADRDADWLAGLVAENRRKEAAFAVRVAAATELDDGLHPHQLLAAVNRIVDEKTIVIADGGDILSWARTGLRAPTYLDLGAFGCLGTGIPYAVAAALGNPGRRVIAVVGDGAFGFNAMELETAVREGARIVVVVADNSAWNIERADQLENYGGETLGTELSTCDLGMLARSLGAHGERVEHPADLDAALTRALAAAPAVVDVRVSRQPRSADTKGGLAAVPPHHVLLAWDGAERAWLEGSDQTGHR
ncbi:MAG: thiamine pyrophosphate-binding protein [Actinobacteria bacterium]|nr:thiamine pyrophosphate-binding protein [Actinomycetota bacterium]